jgi:acyl-coenzyme A synthetase/AMP-(fatty) acid ligase
LTKQWAAALADHNLQAGDRIGICLQDTWEFVVAMLAANRANLTIVTLDWRASPHETERMTRHFQLHAVLNLPAATPVPDVVNITIDEHWHQNLGKSSTRLNPINEQIPVFIKQSSGTTGVPKGIFVQHGQFIDRLMRNNIYFGNLTELRYLSCLPLCFSGGTNYCLFHLILGNTVILYPTLFSASEYVNALKKHRATFAFAVPTVLRWLLQQPRDDKPLLGDLRILLTSTAPLSGDEKQAIHKYICPNFYEIYSSSAAGQICSLMPADIAHYADSVGKANPAIEVQIVDDQDVEVDSGITGRLRCRGAGVSDAFWEDGLVRSGSEQIKDGWCYTGDLAERSPEGYYYLKGRADNVIIRGGINIYPETVEIALRAHPLVAEVAVFSRPDTELGQQVIAAVVSDSELQAEELLAHCRNLLAPHMIPEEIIFKSALPKTSAGKIKTAELH